VRLPVDVLGIPVLPITWSELRDDVLARISNRVRTTVMYGNIHVVNTAHDIPELAEALRAADLVYCDGEGVRLGARILGERLPERMTGADFVDDLFAHLARCNARVAWIGGAPGVASRALAELERRHPGVIAAYAHDGFFAKDGVDSDTVLDELAAAAPDIVLVGMGTPIQELWVTRYRSRMTAPVVWCIGATADFVTGVQRRGPQTLTRHRLEWLARLASDPRRMFGRYVVGNPLFLARVVRVRWARARGA
jgi:N-acetylglucosaminyldiphosphoundecaprenol N-acetyl-beta-D-mannosaminyltransferase